MFCERGSDGKMVIYSYGAHFPIAKETDFGYIFNSEGYSNSTEKHKNIVLEEIKYDTVVKLPNCNPNGASEQYKLNNERIKEFEKKLKRARTKHDDYKWEIEHLKEQNRLLKKYFLKERIVDEIST